MIADRLGARLESVVERFERMALREYRLPGAVLGVLDRGEETYVPVGEGASADRVFPLYSATKLLTATLVMRLVDRGLVELDAPVGAYVREFRPPDVATAAEVTVRRLLAHTSGLRSGDLEELQPAPAGDEDLAAYVARSRDLRTMLPPGEIYSYSSTGYAVLGRLVETISGEAWPRALGHDLLEQLGMRGTAARPDAAQAGPAFCDGPAWLMPVDQAVSTARDMLAFARLHLDHRDPALRDLLGDGAVREMRREHVPLPNPVIGYAGGLAWRLFSTEVDLVGLQGVGYGHTMALWLLPARDLAVVVVAFHAEAEVLVYDIEGRLFRGLLAVEPRMRARAVDPMDAARVGGVYEAPGVRLRVEPREGRLALTCEQRSPRGATFSALAGREVTLRPTDSEGDFLVRDRGEQFFVRFRQLDAGRFKYLHLWSQAALRAQ